MKSTTTKTFEDNFENQSNKTESVETLFDYKDEDYNDLIKMYTDHEEGS